MAGTHFMILCLTIVCTLLAVHPPLASAQTPFKELFFEQTIDHFNSYWTQYGKRTYQQRYLIQDKWWTPGKGPIFFYTGNEGDIVNFWNNTGFMFEIAPKFNALILFAEHRYYGKSLPFGELSFKQPRISLLSSQQALADFAVLLDHLKTSLNATTCKVIAFGGSYGGMLSAYMRIKYPNLIDGSIAASAPVYLIGGDSSRDFFFEDVSADFKAAGCDDLVRAGFSKMVAMSGAKDGLKKLSTDFMLCKYMKQTSDFSHLLAWLRNAFTLMAMMDYPYETNFMSKMPAWPVNEACKMMKNVKDPVKGLVQVAGIVYAFKQNSCHDIWTDYVECADPTGCGTGPDSYAWDYQACTDFLMPSGTNNKTDMFPVMPFTVEQRKAYCEKRWQVTPDVEWAKLSFWGKELKHTSNIVFSNGLLDPWHRGGVLKNLSDSLIAITIKEGAHHLDLRSANKKDPESVKVARQKEIDIITSWLSV